MSGFDKKEVLIGIIENDRLVQAWCTQLDPERIASCDIDRVIAKPFQVDQINELVSVCFNLFKQRLSN